MPFRLPTYVILFIKGSTKPWSPPGARIRLVKYRWNVLSIPEEQIHSLSQRLNVPPLVARLLIHRGITDPDKAHRFLQPRLEDSHDPYLMKDMDCAIERIFRALGAGEKILIYGDYDVDGITATAVLKRALEMLGARVDFYLPHRLEEGYGIKTEVLRKAYGDGYRLVITTDSGVRAFDAGEVSHQLGLDLIVTDHHLPESVLPTAHAVLNPKRTDCAYPYKDLSAVGVVFKLVQALFRKADKDSVLEHFLKLVAIGTIGDVVPITGENRIFVKFGLRGLAEPRNRGLKALLASVGVKGEVSLFDVGFKLAPRINAVTRMGGSREAVELFSVENDALAASMVREMNEKNLKRQQEEQKVLAEIEKQAQGDPQFFDKPFLILSGQGWHRGVIGIVASRLVERFYRPALVLSLDGSSCQGSGRSIPEFHLLEAMDQCRDLLLHYGGHAQAAGCTLDPAKAKELGERLEQYAARRLSSKQLIPSLEIESLLPTDKLSLPVFDEVQQLAPFGVGNPFPIFASQKVRVVGGPWVLKERHLKFQVHGNGSPTDAIWWKHGAMADTINKGSELDLAYSMSREVYQGEEKLLLTIRDLRHS